MDISISKLMNLRFDQPIKSHLKLVYSTLAMSILSATAGAYVNIYTNLSRYIGSFLLFIVMTGLMIALFMTKHNPKNNLKRLGYLLGFTFLSGFSAGSLIEATLHINPDILPKALISAGLIFICFSLSSIYGNTLQTLYYGGLLFSGLSFLSFMAILNIFFNSQWLYQAYCYLAFFIMCGFVMYDTAYIIQRRSRGDTDYISHAILLFMDLINIFRYLLIILTEKERNNRKKRRD